MCSAALLLILSENQGRWMISKKFFVQGVLSMKDAFSCILVIWYDWLYWQSSLSFPTPGYTNNPSNLVLPLAILTILTILSYPWLYWPSSLSCTTNYPWLYWLSSLSCPNLIFEPFPYLLTYLWQGENKVNSYSIQLKFSSEWSFLDFEWGFRILVEE